MSTKIDLIIPAYNEEETIRRSMESVYNQQLKNKFYINLIVVINGSSDNTLGVAKKAIKKSKNISTQVINITQRGKGTALNEGLRLAKNKYIAYMDADSQLGTNVIDKTFSELISNKNLKLVGALDIPIYKFLNQDSLLLQIQKVQQIHREERKRVIPCGRYVCFKRKTVDCFPENIHSEDTWLALNTAHKYGWQSIRVLQQTKVFFTPPTNWLDYIKQQARFERGYDQLIEKFPHLERTWESRRKKPQYQVNNAKIDRQVWERMKKEKIPKQRLKDLNDIFDKVFIETSQSLNKQLVDNQGKWEPIISTKKTV